jgi:hypothetical protein
VSPRINFIPNDPAVLRDMPIRAVASSPNRRAGRATFLIAPKLAQAKRYPPDSREFLAWQCREAALRAVATFERLAGPLRTWVNRRRRIRLVPDDGVDLNAYYDRDLNGCFFYRYETDGHVTRTGTSTDVVAHEIGHALLDTIRPDLYYDEAPEHAAFHEAFGDCMALLTALGDSKTRLKVVGKTRDLRRATFVDALMEDLAAGSRRAYGAGDPGSRPRRALNRFRWQAPTTLPVSGGPSVLTGDAHSFSRVFTGCFYDVIREIFRGSRRRDAAALRNAADVAGRLLIQGTRAALEEPRFFRAVGEAMLQADARSYGGAHQQAITEAFESHNIALAPPARVFSVRSAVTGGAMRGAGPRGAFRSRPTASPRTLDAELKRQLGAAPGQRIERTSMRVAAPNAQKVVVRREVSLTGLSERLAGVVARMPRPVVVSRQKGAVMLRSSIPSADATDEEARFFVATLLARDAIDFADRKTRPGRAARLARREGPAVRATRVAPRAVTHAVRKRSGKRVLVRLRFSAPRTASAPAAGGRRTPRSRASGRL